MQSPLKTAILAFVLGACFGADTAATPAEKEGPRPDALGPELIRPDVPGADTARPNILWLTAEDIGPHLGAYGDPDAATPNLDRLAARGMIYRSAWSNAPVCAPARTAIISGMYPTSTGSEHMRSLTRLPPAMKMFPQYLRAAGYYCSNNSKEDYNLQKPGVVWDDSSGKAHWKSRKPGQPFFAVFNFTVTHESQVRKRPHKAIHDPARIRIPAYHPDVPEVRRDWAQYHDQISVMDSMAAERLREIADAGLADDTIVFFYGDHGPGMPRSKRWPLDSGLRVPLIVVVPERFRRLAPQEYRPGRESDRLVAFVDLAPTVLSLAGIEPPAHMQGRAFMGSFDEGPFEGGPFEGGPAPYLHGFRGRMDERYDLVRSTSDGRYVYVRQYMPHRIYGQHVSYMFETPTTRVWKEMYDAGELDPPRTLFWERKPPEELYDLRTDPDEVRNLAASPEHREVLDRFRKAQREHLVSIRDVGFLPEGEIHSRSEGSTPYEMGHDPARYPMERILAAADLASALSPGALPALRKALGDPDGAVRFWAALGILMREKPAVDAARGDLLDALRDPSPYVRVAAAEALAMYGADGDLQRALDALIDCARADRHGVHVASFALNSIDELGGKAAPLLAAIRALAEKGPGADERSGSYVGRLKKTIVARLGGGR